MNILGIETSSGVCSVGIVGDDDFSLERSIADSHIHSEKLQVMIRGLLKETNVKLNEIDAVAISIGPGSFTGLRIGLSSAKGLCYALDKPILAVHTFDAIAAAASSQNLQTLAVVIDAKQSDFYVGVFRNIAGLIEPESEVSVVPLDRITLESPTVVITDSAEKLRPVLGDGLAYRHVHEFCRGDVVARLGLKKYLAKEFSDVASLEPLYLKDFVLKGPAVVAHA